MNWLARKHKELARIQRDAVRSSALGIEAKQVVGVKRLSDQSVELVFSSCRAASAFVKALEELKEH